MRRVVKIALIFGGLAAVVGMLIGVGIAVQQDNSSILTTPRVKERYEAEEGAGVPAVKKAPTVEVKTETETISIEYETIYHNDSSMAEGDEKVVTAGRNGEKTLYYSVTYTDGKETARELVDTVVTRVAVDEVVARGTAKKTSGQATKSCANGSYVNSAGDTVCRPSSDNTGGATAICRDRTYSYSKSRRGTCSHHGGVSKWL